MLVLLACSSFIIHILFFFTQVQHCVQCQRTKRKFDHPAAGLHHMPIPNNIWKQVDIDLIGPLHCAPNGTIVVTDYFSKWPEAQGSQKKKKRKKKSLFMWPSFLQMYYLS